MNSVDRDWDLRLAAFAQLTLIVERRGGVALSKDLDDGFEFGGERIRYVDPRRRGIWRPKQLGDGAPLSILTAPPHAGRAPAYDDDVGGDKPYFVYRYQGSDPETWTNRALRQARTERRPLIYFYGVAASIYQPIFPCFVQDENQGELAFHVAPGAAIGTVSHGVEAVVRAYETVEVKRRLHQQRFRQLVMTAYGQTCAMCRLKHEVLLDAAHILPDKDERGRPEVPNGMCLCKIHHAAYDANIIGVDPDYVIHVRADILKERDGPMLLHGLQEMNGEEIRVPRAQLQRPRQEYLEERFGGFRAA